jgi:hypothetical protein
VQEKKLFRRESSDEIMCRRRSFKGVIYVTGSWSRNDALASMLACILASSLRRRPISRLDGKIMSPVGFPKP